MWYGRDRFSFDPETARGAGVGDPGRQWGECSADRGEAGAAGSHGPASSSASQADPRVQEATAFFDRLADGDTDAFIAMQSHLIQTQREGLLSGLSQDRLRSLACSGSNSQIRSGPRDSAEGDTKIQAGWTRASGNLLHDLAALLGWPEASLIVTFIGLIIVVLIWCQS